MKSPRLPNFFLQVLGAALPLLLLAPAAQADEGDPSVKCSDSSAADTAFNPSYVDCTAHYDDVPAPMTTLVNPFGSAYGDFLFIGQTTLDPASGGPFEPFGPGTIFGTLTLKAPLGGTFVIALASFNDYSLYLYDAGKVVGDVGSIAFDTFGTTNAFRGPYQLEYANLYAPAPVPEPGSAAMALAGLALTGSLWLRRRRAA